MITLHDDVKVQIDGMRIDRIYSGMMEGIPTQDMNNGIIEKAKTSFAKDWGQRKTHVVEPTRTIPEIASRLPEIAKNCYPNPERLPDYMFQIWLISYTAYDPNDDGTEVVLILFANSKDFAAKSVAELITEASKTFKWQDIAAGFGF